MTDDETVDRLKCAAAELAGAGVSKPAILVTAAIAMIERAAELARLRAALAQQRNPDNG